VERKFYLRAALTEVRGAGQKTNIVGNKPRSKEHMNTIITKKYAGKVALVTDGSRGIGPPTVNSGETDSRAPSIKYQPGSKRSYFDVGVGSVCLSGYRRKILPHRGGTGAGHGRASSYTYA
jgi:hypothetical protein